MHWTAERDDQLKALLADGKTASEISAEMKFGSRSAVLGRIFRLGLNSNRPKVKQPSKPRARRAALPKPIVTPLSVPVNLPAAVEIGIQATRPVDAPTDGVFILDLREHHCRWVLGDAADMRFCGGAKAAGSSYCPEHTARVTGRAIPRTEAMALAQERLRAARIARAQKRFGALT